MIKAASRFPKRFNTPRGQRRLKCNVQANYQCGGKCQPLKNKCSKEALGMAKDGLAYLKAVEERKARIAAVNAKRGGRTQYAVDDLGNVSRGTEGRAADPGKRFYKGGLNRGGEKSTTIKDSYEKALKGIARLDELAEEIAGIADDVAVQHYGGLATTSNAILYARQYVINSLAQGSASTQNTVGEYWIRSRDEVLSKRNNFLQNKKISQEIKDEAKRYWADVDQVLANRLDEAYALQKDLTKTVRSLPKDYKANLILSDLMRRNRGDQFYADSTPYIEGISPFSSKSEMEKAIQSNKEAIGLGGVPKANKSNTNPTKEPAKPFPSTQSSIDGNTKGVDKAQTGDRQPSPSAEDDNRFTPIEGNVHRRALPAIAPSELRKKTATYSGRKVVEWERSDDGDLTTIRVMQISKGGDKYYVTEPYPVKGGLYVPLTDPMSLREANNIAKRLISGALPAAKYTANGIEYFPKEYVDKQLSTPPTTTPSPAKPKAANPKPTRQTKDIKVSPAIEQFDKMSRNELISFIRENPDDKELAEYQKIRKQFSDRWDKANKIADLEANKIYRSQPGFYDPTNEGNKAEFKIKKLWSTIVDNGITQSEKGTFIRELPDDRDTLVAIAQSLGIETNRKRLNKIVDAIAEKAITNLKASKDFSEPRSIIKPHRDRLAKMRQLSKQYRG